MPTTAMRENEAITPSPSRCRRIRRVITFILGRQPSDTRKMEGSPMDVGNPKYGSQEALVVFDDVFVPWERVFMCGEHEQSGKVVERFAAYHRQSYGAVRWGSGRTGRSGQLAAFYGGS